MPRKPSPAYESLNKRNRRRINMWMVAFFSLLILGMWENSFIINRWWAIRSAMYRGDHRMAWNLLGRGLTDPNE